MALTKAAQYRAYAAESLANAEAAADRTTRDINLAIAQHFCLVAEEALSRVATQHPQQVSAPLARPLVDAEG